jgi:hypothetical protein
MGTTLYAVLRAPLELCVSRTVGRRSAELSDPAVIEQLWREFEDLGEFGRHALDTTAMSVEQSATAILERLSGRQLIVSA